MLDGTRVAITNGLNDDFVATISRFTSFNVPCPSYNVSIIFVFINREKMINKFDVIVVSMY